MNYFELLDIPVTFQPDQAVLLTKFQALSRRYDPEFPDKVAHLHKAYNTLRDPDDTLTYLLQLKGLLDEQYKPDPQFLLEVMDINETLMEVELDENQELLTDAAQKANRLMIKLYDEVSPVMDNYQEGVTTEEALLQVKEFYHRKKYVQGILDRITGIRNIASP